MSALRALEREKEISFPMLVEAIESALLIAYQRTEGHQPRARVELDRKSGHVTVWAAETDEEGSVLREWDDTPTGFGRIAATTAKQVILQRLRDAEDEQTFGEFSGREGDIVSGVVQQGKDPRNVFVDLGKIEAVLPPPEQVPGENYEHGMPAALLRRAGAQGPARAVDHAVAHPPQPGPQAVRPRGARDRRRHGRDRGDRPRGRPPHQDRGEVQPAGRQRQGRLHRADGLAGPGRDGRAARREDRHRRLVGGPGPFLAQALQPARVLKVEIVDLAARSARITVPDYQLSLAIGKEGQNARLAARLTGWRIDIRPDVDP